MAQFDKNSDIIHLEAPKNIFHPYYKHSKLEFSIETV